MKKYYNNYNKFKNTTKEERANDLHNIICPRCKYQNHDVWIKKYGKCNLCECVLDKNYFIRTIQRRLSNG